MQPLSWQEFFLQLYAKFQNELKSRKFWSLALALVATWGAYLNGQISAVQAVTAMVTALSVYALGTGLEDGLRASKP